ncbi:SGNH/GDSL hydrolase family protein [Limosilactobacillus reuteri]|uniref:SGNH/GDSL hydrolase family protein n=1 Tax=Limosilactobacillus reuteri TaxID=1598 RepID=UPI003D070188
MPIRNYQLGKLISTNHPGIGVWDDESWIDASKVRSSNHNLLNDAILWNGGQYDALSFNNDELVKTSGDLSYNSGIAVPVEVDTKTDQYIKIIYGVHGFAKGAGSVSTYLGNEKLALQKSLGSVKVADTAYTITAHITPEMFNQYGIKDKFYLVVGGRASALFFKQIQVSSLPIERTLTTAISHLHDGIGEPAEKFYGQSIGGIETATKVTVDGLTYGTSGVGYDGDNGRLKSIQAYVPAQGTYNFVVGKLDQHNLLVNGTNFTVDLGQGSNNVDMSSRNIQINNGDIVFMDLSKVGVYTPDRTHPQYLDSMLQDNSHPSTTPGYPGQMFYDANYLVPFSYSVASMNLPQQIEDLKAELATTKQKLSAAKTKKVNVISAPNGQSYRLIVANNGSLSAVSTTPSNVTIFGNSLTYEHGKIGMAASDANHDWYHYVTDYIKSKNASVKINDRTNMSIWESATSTADREKVFNDSIKPLLSADTDLVIIQLGDNVNTAEKKATFAHDTGELLQQIHAVSPKAQVYWIYGWFGNYPEIFTPIQTACDGNGAIGIDIRDLNKSGNTSYVGATRTGLDGSTWKITNPGEAAHPGDAGMKAIADRVISNFDF